MEVIDRGASAAFLHATEQQIFARYSECLIKSQSGEIYTQGLRRHLPPDAAIAKYMWNAARFSPRDIDGIFGRYKEQTIIITADKPIAVVESGAVALFRAIDCLGVVVASTDKSEKPLITALHRSIFNGYSLDDIRSAFTPHANVDTLSFAIVGVDESQEKLNQFDIIQPPKEIQFYENMAREICGQNIKFGTRHCKIGVSKPVQIARGIHQAFSIYTDTNTPDQILVDQLQLNVSRIGANYR
ncbi:hypothetical protein KBD45_01265 [Candidatus Dojkabacteria bacterium]|nr:hypothetical protein [Candidatus Dojkabacteria bacterium]